MLRIVEGPLHSESIYTYWYARYSSHNYGAYITFTGIVRAEKGVDALSFDIHEPMLRAWFDAWQSRAATEGAIVLMAHSNGDVPIHECSYIAAVLSQNRKVALKMIDEFVEDFKANAPIWKYDVKENKRIYAMDRSTPIEGAGILSTGRANE